MYAPLSKFFHEKYTPKMNPVLAGGLAVEHLKHVESWVSNMIHSALEGCDERFKFVGMTRCDAEAAYRSLTRKRTNKKKQTCRREFEMAHSSVFMTELNFTWDGIRLRSRPMLLPYVKAGGLLQITGSQYAIFPVLTDKTFSPGENSLYLPLSGTRQNYFRAHHPYITNDNITREWVVYSTLHHNTAKKGKVSVRGECALAHYLFAKYGVKETFRKYGNCNTVMIHQQGENDFDVSLYPDSDWVVCRTMGAPPQGIIAKNSYIPSGLIVCIPRPEFTPMVSFLIAGLFHVVDLFPQNILADYIYKPQSEFEVADELRMWRVLLGRLLWGDVSEGKLEEDINSHIGSLDMYIDAMSRSTLADDNIFVENFYDLLAHIVETFAERIIGSADNISSMYDKSLTLLRYVCFPITEAFFTVRYRIPKNSTYNTPDEIDSVLNKILIPELIISINNKHGEVVPISTCSDNMVLSVTSTVIPQRNSSGGKKGRTKISLQDPTKHLHASVAEIGSHLCMQKADPTGQGRLNTFANVTPTGDVLRHEAFRELLDSAQEIIKR